MYYIYFIKNHVALENVSRFEVYSIESVSRGRYVRINVMDLLTHLMLLHAKIEELFEFTSKVGLYIKLC